jgi:MinD-like ATPase involved in chromosome partitioning or flagellar assembly
MAKIISIHSFRRGTGKSSLVANMAALLAAEGRRVGAVDADLQSPSLHILFGLSEKDVGYSLNDYLRGKCSIEQAAHAMTSRLGADVEGQIFLVPSNADINEIARALREGYNVDLLNEGLHQLRQALALDVLLVDTHAGLSEETLLSIAISDALGVIMRPDQQDYQGTAITVAVARKLGVPRLALIVNQAPSFFDPSQVKEQVESAYQCEVIAALPHCDEMMALASAGLFVLRYPAHPMTASLKQVADKLMA